MANVYYDCEFLEGTQDVRILGINTGIKTKPTIDLISIGMIREDGQEYYAISKDFNLKEAWNRYDVVEKWVSLDNLGNETLKKTKLYWIRENVLKPIWKDLVRKHNETVSSLSLTINHKNESDFTYKNMKYLIESYGKSNDQIKKEIIHFCSIRIIEYPSYDKDGSMTREEHAHGENINLYGYYSAYDHVALSWIFGKMIDLPKNFPMYTRDLKQMFDEKQELVFTNKKTVYEIIQEFEKTGQYPVDKTEYNLKKHPLYPKQSNEHNALSDARWNKELHEFLKSI